MLSYIDNIINFKNYIFYSTGYVITELPTLSEDTMTTLQQIELIKNLNLKPDIIINIKVRILVVLLL